MNNLLVVIGIFTFILTSCGSGFPKDKYCGQEMTHQELQKLSEHNSASFKYSEKDLDLLADITTDVQALFKDSLVIEVFFFIHDKNQIGVMIIGLDDPTVVEKISCLLLSDKYNKVLPNDRYLLFYCNEHENLVAGIRNKK